MARIGCMAMFFLFACSGSSTTDDAGITAKKPAGAACKTGDECLGGTCLGAEGQPQDGNPRFTGGYCSSLGCTPDTQDGCGADEWCVDGGEALGGFCVEMCSRAEGLVCERGDHVCLGVGFLGGCFSEDAVECDRPSRTGCKPEEICVKIGFEDQSPLGRCETVCDPMDDQCGDATACYFIRTYSTAFCGVPGKLARDASCSCDKCCEPGLACTPDLDGDGRHCKDVCAVATQDGCAPGETCVPLKVGSPWGGCVEN